MLGFDTNGQAGVQKSNLSQKAHRRNGVPGLDV